MARETRGIALRHLKTVLTSGAVGSLPDAMLLERFLAGRGDADSSAAIAVLVERHGSMVLGVCRDILANRHDAEDAPQATFLVLAKNGAAIRRANSLASWLYGVALRVAATMKADTVRRRILEFRAFQMTGDREATQEPDVSLDIHDELARLPQRYRAPLVLCYLEGLSSEQAAGQLGLTVRTLQRRLLEGRERLRARLTSDAHSRPNGSVGAGIAMESARSAWFSSTVRAATALAAGQTLTASVSPAVASLTNRVFARMLTAHLKLISAGIAAAAIFLVVALTGASHAFASRRPEAREGAQAASRDASDTTDLSFGLWIKGIVVDTSGKPVASVRVTSQMGNQRRVVTAKPDGTFAIWSDRAPARFASLLATADGGAQQGVYRFFDRFGVQQDPRTLARIVLKPAHDIIVSVVDARGVAVEGARVVLLDVASAVDDGLSDARGVITLRAAKDAIMHWLFAYKPEVGLDYFENDPFMPLGWSALPDRVKLTLDGAQTVQVRVVDSSNRPVAGVEVVPLGVHKEGKLFAVNGIDSVAKARTDSNGIATFDWLPAAIQARATVIVDAPGYSAVKWPIFDPAAPHGELTVRLRRCTRLSGKVTRPDGSAASGIPVLAECLVFSFPKSGGETVTGADGTYSIDLPPERPYAVYVSHDGLAGRSQRIVHLIEGKPEKDIDLRLEKGATVRGRVTFGAQRQSAKGVELTLIDEEPDAWPNGNKCPQRFANVGGYKIETDRDGRYAVVVQPGNYSLRAPSSARDAAASEFLRLGIGQEIVRDFWVTEAAEKNGTFRGVVRSGDRNGPHVARATVVVAPLDGDKPGAECFAGSDGRFVLPRPAGKNLVYARNSEGNFAGFIILGPDQNSESTIVVRPSAVARGRLVDRAGLPLSYARVVLAVLPAVRADDDFEITAQWVMSDSQGRFTVGGLPPGTRTGVHA